MQNLAELVKQIEAELFDLPYAVSVYGNVVRVVRYERVMDSKFPHCYQAIEKKRYEVRNQEEWNTLREDLAPTSGMLGSYEIYSKDPDEAVFKALADKLLKALAYRGISVKKGAN